MVRGHAVFCYRGDKLRLPYMSPTAHNIHGQVSTVVPAILEDCRCPWSKHSHLTLPRLE